MKLEQSGVQANVVHFAAWGANRLPARHASEQAFATLRELWPNVVDLAKQPGVMHRLQTMLSD